MHAFVNDRARPIGTYLFGRRMYEVMVFWETAHEQLNLLPFIGTTQGSGRRPTRSTTSTLADVGSARTRIESRFDPVARRLKADATADLSIGGADLAAQALRAGLVEEVADLLAPVVVGGGTSLLPQGLRLDLELLEERRFRSGFVYLRYHVGR